MTENEATELLNASYIVDWAGDVDRRRIKLEEFLISALEEVQKYRQIGTVEECREAVEKQKSKSPTLEGDGYDGDGEMIYDTWICPSCGEDYEVDYDDYDFCPNCGQRILH